MELDLRVKGPGPGRARVNADATAEIQPASPPAEKVPVKAEAEGRAALLRRPREAKMPAGDRDPEDRVETDSQLRHKEVNYARIRSNRTDGRRFDDRRRQRALRSGKTFASVSSQWISHGWRSWFRPGHGKRPKIG